MPYTMRQHDNGTMVTLRFTGEVTEDDVIRSFEERFDSQFVDHLICVLVDYTETTKISLTTQGMDELAARADQISKRIPDLILAGIHPQDLSYGLARMQAAHMTGTGWSIGVFRNRPAARTWLEHQGITISFTDDGEIRFDGAATGEAAPDLTTTRHPEAEAS